ncbi:YbjN domain-containing protein [Actinoallomurus sp. CA-150999]|uniref:YbjN domain-containing protein n=1 Tax=Actinoallomurus sp. CA-150999 TaxID=3239887 RepID=UPI003D92E63F
MEAEPPSSPSSSGPHACVVRPDLELLEDVLDQLEISSFRDSRGRLGTRWPCFSLFFTIHDEDEVFSARTIYDHFFSVEDKSTLCGVLDEWNRDTTGLKVYTATDDDGSVIIVSEAMMRVDGGVTREQFAASTAVWLGNAGSFHLWLTQRLSLSGLAGEPL